MHIMETMWTLIRINASYIPCNTIGFALWSVYNVLYQELPKQISSVLLWYSWSSLQPTNTTIYGSSLITFLCICSQHELTWRHQGTEDKLDWSVCTCLTQLYHGRDMYRIYYIKNNYMFRHLTLAIFRLRNEKT
jgi:hypothetical protein